MSFEELVFLYSHVARGAHGHRLLALAIKSGNCLRRMAFQAVTFDEWHPNYRCGRLSIACEEQGPPLPPGRRNTFYGQNLWLHHNASKLVYASAFHCPALASFHRDFLVAPLASSPCRLFALSPLRRSLAGGQLPPLPVLYPKGGFVSFPRKKRLPRPCAIVVIMLRMMPGGAFGKHFRPLPVLYPKGGLGSFPRKKSGFGGRLGGRQGHAGRFRLFLLRAASYARIRSRNRYRAWEAGMSRASLEQRVATLEKQVSTLLADQSGRTKDWRRTSGAFTGDEVMKEIFEEGRKIREAERKRARRRSGQSRKARS